MNRRVNLRGSWVVGAALAALAATGGGAGAQEWTLNGGAVVPLREDMGGGPLVGGAVLFRSDSRLAVRVSGGVGFAEAVVPILDPGFPAQGYPPGLRRQDQVVFDLSTSLVLQRTAGAIRPFAYGGVGYYRFPAWSEGRSWLYGGGLNAGVGVAIELGGREVSLDLGLRSFGGYLAGPSGEMTFSPVTVGFRF